MKKFIKFLSKYGWSVAILVALILCFSKHQLNLEMWDHVAVPMLTLLFSQHFYYFVVLIAAVIHLMDKASSIGIEFTDEEVGFLGGDSIEKVGILLLLLFAYFVL